MQRSCKVNQLSGALFNLFAIDKACFCQGVTNCRFLIQACNLVANGLVAPLNITFCISRHFHYVTQSLIIYLDRLSLGVQQNVASMTGQGRL